MKRKIAALAAMTLITSANAQFMSGNELYRLLTTQQSSSDYITAQGYIMGVIDSQNGNYFCVPDGFTGQQGFDLVRNGLRDHPENRQLSAHFLISLNFAKIYPCKANK